MTKYIGAYDAGSIDVSSVGVKVGLELEVRQLLIYPTVDSFVTLNDFTKQIFLPKNMWTPITVSNSWVLGSFTVISQEAGKIHWQGWVV